MKLNLIGLTLATAGLLASCAEVKEDNVDSAEEVREIASADTAVMYSEDALMAGVTEADMLKFKEVDFDAPVIDEPTLTKEQVEVRGNDNYRVYSVGEDIMFDLDKAQLRPDAEKKLEEIVNVIKRDNPEGMIRVYGFTDSLAGETYNKKLAMDRAKSVQDWLQKNSGLDTARMKLVPVGEHMFEATNETARGRQQNRRVEIVVVEK